MGTGAAGRVFPVATKSGEDNRILKEGRFEKFEYSGDVKELSGGRPVPLFLRTGGGSQW